MFGVEDLWVSFIVIFATCFRGCFQSPRQIIKIIIFKRRFNACLSFKVGVSKKYATESEKSEKKNIGRKNFGGG